MIYRLKWTLKIKTVVGFRRKHSWSVMFFGSDYFSLRSLQKLNEHVGNDKIIKNLEVVTSVTPKLNAVAQYAHQEGITVNPYPLEVPESHFDIGVVVSFGHLIPKKIIDYFPLGIINVHASLLPRWRGAAPIIHAIMNGDTETGISIMKIDPEHFDTGKLIMQKKCSIGQDELMPSLYERLSILGAECLIQTIERLPECLYNAKPQSEEEPITYAKRVSKKTGIVQWKKLTSVDVYNLFRSIQGVHQLSTIWHQLPVKLSGVTERTKDAQNDVEPRGNERPGYIHFSKNKKILYVRCKDNTWIRANNLVIGGKNLKPIDFYNGYVVRIPLEKRFFTSL